MHSTYKLIKQWSFDKESEMFTKQDGDELYSLMEMTLDTGKKHQLRMACSYALASPIIGDRKYGY